MRSQRRTPQRLKPLLMHRRSKLALKRPSLRLRLKLPRRRSPFSSTFGVRVVVIVVTIGLLMDGPSGNAVPVALVAVGPSVRADSNRRRRRAGMPRRPRLLAEKRGAMAAVDRTARIVGPDMKVATGLVRRASRLAKDSAVTGRAVKAKARGKVRCRERGAPIVPRVKIASSGTAATVARVGRIAATIAVRSATTARKASRARQHRPSARPSILIHRLRRSAR